jgi:hypothetical protein
MNTSELLKHIEELHYWDARVISLTNNYFGDEVVLVYEDTDSEVVYKFTDCYRVLYNHALEYDKEKPISSYTKTQLPYFMQNVELEDVECLDNRYIKCKISMPPLELEILCKKIEVSKK